MPVVVRSIVLGEEGAKHVGAIAEDLAEWDPVRGHAPGFLDAGQQAWAAFEVGRGVLRAGRIALPAAVLLVPIVGVVVDGDAADPLDPGVGVVVVVGTEELPEVSGEDVRAIVQDLAERDPVPRRRAQRLGLDGGSQVAAAAQEGKALRLVFARCPFQSEILQITLPLSSGAGKMPLAATGAIVRNL